MDTPIIFFLKKYPPHHYWDAKKKRLFLGRQYLEFCARSGMPNSIRTYTEYRAACRAIFGYNLPTARPMEEQNIIEKQKNLFGIE